MASRSLARSWKNRYASIDGWPQNHPSSIVSRAKSFAWKLTVYCSRVREARNMVLKDLDWKLTPIGVVGIQWLGQTDESLDHEESLAIKTQKLKFTSIS